MTKSQILENIVKINRVKNFHAEWNEEYSYMQLYYKNVELFRLADGYPFTLPRQFGYSLKISDMNETELEFLSAEEKYIGKGESELYHNHFYFITETVSPSKVMVLIKYFDIPDYKKLNDADMYLEQIKSKVRNNPNYQLIDRVYGLDDFDIKLDIGGFRIRPKQDGPFYFQSKLDVDTYGDVMLKVDQIIHDLEN